MAYDPRTARYLCFAEARAAFAAGRDTPRAFLERCLEAIAAREPKIMAFVRLDRDGARAAADRSSERWRADRPLSPVDGMPVGIKDCYDVQGMPTEVNSRMFKDNVAALDAAHVDALRRGGAIILGKTTTTELTMALPAPTVESVGFDAHAGRIVVGIGRGGGRTHAAAGDREPGARLGRPPGLDLRRHRHEADLRRAQPLWRVRSVAEPQSSRLSRRLAHRHHGRPRITSRPVSAAIRATRHSPAGPICPRRAALRLARQYTYGWSQTDDASKEMFEAFLHDLAAKGVEIVEPERRRGFRRL